MPIVRLPKGELRDEIRQPLYDTIDLDDATVLPAQFSFSQPFKESHLFDQICEQMLNLKLRFLSEYKVFALMLKTSDLETKT